MQSALRTPTARIVVAPRVAALPRCAFRGQARFSSSDPANDHTKKVSPCTPILHFASSS